MKKIITSLALLLAIHSGISPVIYAEEEPSPPCGCYSVPCPEQLDPSAPITGANYSLDIAYVGLGVVVVAGAAALIITSSHGSHHGHHK